MHMLLSKVVAQLRHRLNQSQAPFLMISHGSYVAYRVFPSNTSNAAKISLGLQFISIKMDI
jgi:hypothetical protein